MIRIKEVIINQNEAFPWQHTEIFGVLHQYHTGVLFIILFFSEIWHLWVTSRCQDKGPGYDIVTWPQEEKISSPILSEWHFWSPLMMLAQRKKWQKKSLLGIGVWWQPMQPWNKWKNCNEVIIFKKAFIVTLAIFYSTKLKLGFIVFQNLRG